MSSRRIGRRAVIAAIAGGCALAGTARAAEAPPKVSKAEAKYTDKAEGMFTCAICSFFVQPNACTVIEGEVKAAGWCDLFALSD